MTREMKTFVKAVGKIRKPIGNLLDVAVDIEAGGKIPKIEKLWVLMEAVEEAYFVAADALSSVQEAETEAAAQLSQD